MLTYLLAFASGLAQPMQTSINGTLRSKVKSPYITAVISFGMAFTGLAVVTLVAEGNFNINWQAAAGQPLWIWGGGMCGVFIVTLSVVCLPQIGSELTVVLECFGQIVISLIIDHFGLFHSTQISVDFTRISGIALLMVGVILIARDTDASGQIRRYPIKYMALAALAGVFCGLQIAVNGALSSVLGSGCHSAMISTGSGVVLAGLLVGIIFATKGANGVFEEGKDIPFKWYMVTGGLFGTVIVGGNCITAPLLGAGTVSILNLVGFNVGGLAIDATGFLGIEKKRITLIKMIGVVAMSIGVIIVTVL